MIEEPKIESQIIPGDMMRYLERGGQPTYLAGDNSI